MNCLFNVVLDAEKMFTFVLLVGENIQYYLSRHLINHFPHVDLKPNCSDCDLTNLAD